MGKDFNNLLAEKVILPFSDIIRWFNIKDSIIFSFDVIIGI